MRIKIKIDSRLSEHKLSHFRFSPFSSDFDSESDSEDKQEWPKSNDDLPQVWIPQQDAVISDDSDDEMYNAGEDEFPTFTSAEP